MTRLFTILSTCVLLAGCAASPQGPSPLAQANDAYKAGQYDAAYRLAAARVHGDGRSSAQAAYLAGLSAQKLRRFADAERYLRLATQSADSDLANDALVSLGQLYAEHGRYAQAAATFLAVAPRLGSGAGDHRAHAYLHAALAQQKLGQFAQARTNLSMALAATPDPALRATITEVMATTGYTIQVGAFGDASRATAAAHTLAPQAARLHLGQPVLAPRTDGNGRPLTAVQVGAFATFDAANRAKAQLGATAAVIVPLSR